MSGSSNLFDALASVEGSCEQLTLAEWTECQTRAALCQCSATESDALCDPRTNNVRMSAVLVAILIPLFILTTYFALKFRIKKKYAVEKYILDKDGQRLFTVNVEYDFSSKQLTCFLKVRAPQGFCLWRR